MDSKLDGMNLPVLKTQGPRVAELEGPDLGPDLPYRVASVMEHYFEWIGTFQFGAFTGITRLRNINSCARVTKRKRCLFPDTCCDYEIQSGQRKLI